MPCSDGGSYSGHSRAKTDARGAETIKFLEERLCKLTNAIIDSKVPNLVKVVEGDAGLMDWFQDHEARESAELKKAALAKLTPRERRLLGLK